MNPTLWVNKKALINNLSFFKKRTSSSFICPMVKANAYGVGDTLVVGALLEAGVKHFGVARTFEGEKLRRFFPNVEFEILVFNSLTEESVKECIASNLTPVVGSFADLEVLKSFGLKVLELKKVHLKIDLGMTRFGVLISDAKKVKTRLKQMGLEVEGLCGHFPTSEDLCEESGQTAELLKSLLDCAKELDISEERVHAPNSAAIERGDFNVGLRPGIALYGVSQHQEVGLQGALKLTAPLVAVNPVLEGAKVSYGGSWTAKATSLIGVLPIGYADGLRRGLSNRITLSLEGQSCPQVGVICMDYCMIDLGVSSKALKGDEVVLFDGSYKNLFEWSKTLETIPYEFLTGLGDRIERKIC